MARRGGLLATLNGVRYLLFALGVLIFIGSNVDENSNTSDEVLNFASMCVLIGFPLPLLSFVFRFVVAVFRFVVWVLGLFGIVKRKPQTAPIPQMQVAVEWADELATDKQLGFIRHLGGNPPEGLTKGAASEMIDALLLEKDEERLEKARRATRRKKGGGT